ncbi:MAG: hypothetical protein WAU28_02345 [Candidatus Moraniibacteriota bacterium]
MLERLKRLFAWLTPLSLLLVALLAPTYIFKLDFLKLVEIVVWPFTLLIVLFFFKKVFTYMFFSMDEFNFFGLKGTLRNIKEVIFEEANKQFLEKQKEEERERERKKTDDLIRMKESEILKKESEINETKASKQETLDFVKDIIKDWRTSVKSFEKTISDLEAENRRIKDIVSSFSIQIPEASSSDSIDDDIKTSGSISEESSDNK